MDLIQAVILAFVQGITEWLPVSSSGHLVIAQHFLKIEAGVFFDVMLHVGTLIAVIVVFWKRIIELIRAFFTFKFKSKDERLSLFIIAASVPTAIIGFAFKDLFESLFSNITAVAVALLVTGCFIFLTKFARKRKNMGVIDSVLIGIAQGIAIIPGISRSGATISAGLLLGVDKKDAAEFSFLLSIPAILGAFIIKASEVSFLFGSDALAGVAVSAVVGYFSIKVLLGVIQKGKFFYFSYYCWALGIIILATLFL